MVDIMEPIASSLLEKSLLPALSDWFQRMGLLLVMAVQQLKRHFCGASVDGISEF